MKKYNTYKMKSQLFYNCIQQAKQTEDLFPVTCIEIIEKNYGTARMENLKPETLHNMVFDLMGTITDEPDREEITEVVNTWLNSF